MFFNILRSAQGPATGMVFVLFILEFISITSLSIIYVGICLRVYIFKHTAQHGLELMFLEDNSFLFNFDLCLLNQKYLRAVETRKNGCMIYKTCNTPYT